MTEAIRQKSLLVLPPAERPLDFQHISYVKIENRTEASIEISVKLTVYFGKGDPFEFDGGIRYEFKNEECGICESESFAEAAKKVWQKYRKSSDKNRVRFVKGFLLQKWEDLDGQELTKKKLVFNMNSDEIAAPKKHL